MHSMHARHPAPLLVSSLFLPPQHGSAAILYITCMLTHLLSLIILGTASVYSHPHLPCHFLYVTHFTANRLWHSGAPSRKKTIQRRYRGFGCSEAICEKVAMFVTEQRCAIVPRLLFRGSPCAPCYHTWKWPFLFPFFSVFNHALWIDCF
ncbi:hypothetical protein F4859DRAFT_454886 [Xylaria cf. heliscus]|nr:hypothetical protein F4859DRAFT_454886 [Xylaria cf. heliscus]